MYLNLEVMNEEVELIELKTNVRKDPSLAGNKLDEKRVSTQT